MDRMACTGLHDERADLRHTGASLGMCINCRGWGIEVSYFNEAMFCFDLLEFERPARCA